MSKLKDWATRVLNSKGKQLNDAASEDEIVQALSDVDSPPHTGGDAGTEREKIAALEDKIAALEAANKAADAEAVVNSAIAAFRIPAGQKETYMALMAQAPEQTRAILNSMPAQKGSRPAHKPNATSISEVRTNARAAFSCK